jgi:hypothetical protein
LGWYSMTGYEQISDGDVVKIETPENTMLQFQCCDCGLTHDLKFHITKKGCLAVQIFLNRKETIKRREGKEND